MHVFRARGLHGQGLCGLGDYPASNGFCWVPASGDIPGHWERPWAGSNPTTPCKYPPPDSGGAIVRDHTSGGGGGGVTVTESPSILDVAKGTIVNLAMVNRLFNATLKQYTEREALAVKALMVTGEGLPACPPESQQTIDGKPTCYGFTPRTAAAALPGGFEVLGVPFNVSEIGITKKPQFERVFTPNNEQRIMIESMIIRRSDDLLLAALGDALDRAVAASSGGVMTPNDRDRAIAKLSAAQAFALLPDWQTVIPGMALRSDPPRSYELDVEGGFSKWHDRGGFLISRAIATGQYFINVPQPDQARQAGTISPRVCTSILCACSPTGTPSCIADWIPSSDGGRVRLWVHVAIDPNGSMKMTLKHDDPSWLEKAGGKIHAFVDVLNKAICTAAPAIKTQTTSVIADKYVDANGKACTKGATGCNLVQASAAATGGVGLLNFAVGTYCSVIASNQQNPKEPVPPTPTPAPITTTPPWLHYLPWVIGGLALGAGAVVITRR